MSSELTESIKLISKESRVRILEMVKTSPEFEGGTALDWIAEHEDGIYKKAAKLFKTIAEAEAAEENA